MLTGRRLLAGSTQQWSLSEVWQTTLQRQEELSFDDDGDKVVGATLLETKNFKYSEGRWGSVFSHYLSVATARSCCVMRP